MVKPRICSSHLLRLENHCCNTCLLLLPPRASHGAAKGNYWHFRALFVSPSRWNNTTRCTCSRLRHNFFPHHLYCYAFVNKLLQLRVSLRFTAPRYDAYYKIWVKKLSLSFLFRYHLYMINVFRLKQKRGGENLPSPFLLTERSSLIPIKPLEDWQALSASF